MRKITSDFIGEITTIGILMWTLSPRNNPAKLGKPERKGKNIREQNTTSEFFVFWPQLRTLLTFVHNVTYRE